jgi:hypothetical protein
MPFNLGDNLQILTNKPIDTRQTSSNISSESTTYHYEGMLVYQTATAGGRSAGLYCLTSAQYATFEPITLGTITGFELFKDATDAAAGTTQAQLQIGTNLEVDTSGSIPVLNGSATPSVTSVTASGAVTGGSLTDGTLTISNGVISNMLTISTGTVTGGLSTGSSTLAGGNLTASGTISGNSLTDGTATLSNGALASATTIAASGAITGGSFQIRDTTDTYDRLLATVNKVELRNADTTTPTVKLHASGTIDAATITGDTLTVTAGGTITDGTTSLSAGNITNLRTLEITDGTVDDRVEATQNYVKLRNASDTETVTLHASGTVTAIGAMTGGSLTDGTATLSSGALSGATTITAGGAVTGGNFATSGEITISDGTVTNRFHAHQNYLKLRNSSNVETVTLSASGTIDATTITGTTFTDGTASLSEGNLTNVKTFEISDSTIDDRVEATKNYVKLRNASDTETVTLHASGTVTAIGAMTGGSLTDGTATLSNGALASATTITASGAIAGGSLTDGTATLSNGALASATTVTASGAITGGSLTDGTATLSNGALTSMSTIAASGSISTSGVVLGRTCLNKRVGTGSSRYARGYCQFFYALGDANDNLNDDTYSSSGPKLFWKPHLCDTECCNTAMAFSNGDYAQYTVNIDDTIDPGDYSVRVYAKTAGCYKVSYNVAARRTDSTGNNNIFCYIEINGTPTPYGGMGKFFNSVHEYGVITCAPVLLYLEQGDYITIGAVGDADDFSQAGTTVQTGFTSRNIDTITGLAMQCQLLMELVSDA